MFKKTIIMHVLAFIFGVTQLQAQDTLQILNSFILLEVDTAQMHTLPTNINASNVNNISFCVKVVAVFSDTSDIDSVHIKVGRTLGGQDVANVSFAYNGGGITPVLPDFVPNEEGFCICVAPTAQSAHTLYLEIWADDKTGNTTPVYSMQVN